MKHRSNTKHQPAAVVRLLIVLAVTVVLTAVALARMRFAVAPVDAGTAPLTVVAVGDISCETNNPSYNHNAGKGNACQSQATSDLALRLNPAAALILGDEQYRSGKLDQFIDSYDQTWGRLKAISKPVPGNHEYEDIGALGYYRYFGAAGGFPEAGFYSYQLGTWHVVALNANCWAVGGCEVASLQEEWLRHDLEDHRGDCTLAYWHQPRFSSGEHGNNAAYQAFWQDLQDFGADVVLNGHDHDYERFAPQLADGTPSLHGVTEFVVGTGGESLGTFKTARRNSLVRDNQDYGVLNLTLDKGSYGWQFVTTAGSVKDSGSAKCVTRPPAEPQTPAPTPQPRP
jgi:hypothetical protein